MFARFDEFGIFIADIDPALEAAFKDAAKPIATKWIKDTGANGSEALEFYKKRVTKLSK